MFKKSIAITLVTALVAVGYFYKDIDKTLNVATGYAAKQLCSGYYNSGYSFEQIMAEVLLPIDPAFAYVSYSLNEQTQTLHTSVLGLAAREARHREGMGCTLLGQGQSQLLGEIRPQSVAPTDEAAPWPQGNLPPERLEGVNYAGLDSAIAQAFSENQSSGLKQTKAVVVIHKGKLIAEQYVAPLAQNVPSLSNSMAKSVTTLLVGTLQMRSFVDIHAPLTFPEWQNDERRSITLDHLMRMSSGLAFDESYGLNTDVTDMLANKANTARFALNMPLAHPVDTHWAYSSGTTNIIAQAMFDAIGGDLQNKYDYLNQALLGPMGVSNALMELDGSNTFVGSSYFYATARDWAKFGQLMLQNGVWEGQRLLPQNWVSYSTTPSPTAKNREYGAQFWLNSAPVNQQWSPPWPDVPNDAYFMSGYQGQYVVVVPSEDVVVVRLGFTHPGTNSGMNELVSGIIASLNRQ